MTVAALTAAGCRRKPAAPSAEYEKGRTLYQQLYATRLDDAYGDPQMDVAVAHLKQVEPDSADAQAATELLATIERGRAELARTRAEREKIFGAAAQQAAKPVAIDPQAVLARAQPDAGSALDPTGTGASIAELNQENGGCLVADQPFREQGTGKTGTIYKLSPYAACRDKLPGFVGQAVMVVEGRIYRRVPASEAKRTEAPDAGVAAAADAGARAAAPRQASPIPPNAHLVRVDPDGTQHYETTPVMPGAPQPGATPPPSPDPLPDATPRPQQ
jgi:hypothetical protein